MQIAYVPQNPFIFGATVRGNVTFGLDFNEARYEDAIDSASFRPDLETLTGEACQSLRSLSAFVCWLSLLNPPSNRILPPDAL